VSAVIVNAKNAIDKTQARRAEAEAACRFRQLRRQQVGKIAKKKDALQEKLQRKTKRFAELQAHRASRQQEAPSDYSQQPEQHHMSVRAEMAELASPEGRIEYFGDDVNKPIHLGKDKYLGGETGSDGCIYGIPGSARYVLKIEPATGKVGVIGPELTIPVVTTSLKKNNFKWLRGILAWDDCIYGLPANADQAHVQLCAPCASAAHCTCVVNGVPPPLCRCSRSGRRLAR